MHDLSARAKFHDARFHIKMEISPNHITPARACACRVILIIFCCSVFFLDQSGGFNEVSYADNDLVRNNYGPILYRAWENGNSMNKA